MPLQGIFDTPNTYLSVSNTLTLNNATIPNITVKLVKTPQHLIVLFLVKNIVPNLVPTFLTNSHDDINTLGKDYLWQASCYECFIGLASDEYRNYVEINLAPDGYFNFYHFDDYRQPNQMPPRQLTMEQLAGNQSINFFRYDNTKFDSQNRVFWQAPSQLLWQTLDYLANQLTNDSGEIILGMSIDYLDLAIILAPNLPSAVLSQYALQINPCMVIELPDLGLSYWAPQHTNPADFHNRATWLTP